MSITSIADTIEDDKCDLIPTEAKSIKVDGGMPIIGDVKLSGAKNSALKLFSAALLCNDDVTIENVPRMINVLVDIEVIKTLGGKAEWTGENRLVINGSTLNSYEVPYDVGCKYRTVGLLVAPLVYRFGKAVMPKPGGCKIGPRPINRWIETWKSLGMDVEEDTKYVRVSLGQATGGEAATSEPKKISFKNNTHMGTDNAIISSIFMPGETTILNAAEEPEVDDLIAFCNMMGANVARVEPRKIKVVGTNVFTGGYFAVQADRNEAITFASAALATGGNVTIKGVERTGLVAFTSFLSKLGCNYEFSKNEMRVWRSGEVLQATDVTTAPAPGFMTDWQPFAALLLTQAHGEGIIHDTVYTDRFGYTQDLNRMGAKITLHKPSELELDAIISDDSYDYAKLGEPQTVAKIIGPTKLKGTKLDIPDLRAGAALILAALVAEGKSEVGGVENVERGYEHFIDKLTNLGAVIN